MLFKRLQQSRSEAEIAFAKLLRVLRAVDAREVEDEIGGGGSFYGGDEAGRDIPQRVPSGSCIYPRDLRAVHV